MLFTNMTWILISVFAALMQAVRTAAQKKLNSQLSTMATTYVRSLFGLPLLLTYLVAVQVGAGTALPDLPKVFWFYCFGAALAQVAATWLLIYLFTLRNFAVGSMLPKSDIMLTAILGSLFFSEQITVTGWVAIIATLAGVVLIAGSKTGVTSVDAGAWHPRSVLSSRPVRIGLLTGLFFTFSYLFLREASLSLALPFVQSAAWTVAVVTMIQVIVVSAWLLARERKAFPEIWAQRRPAMFVGLTSALGSIGWFTAMTMQNASYVKAVGQVEAIFAILISWMYFRENISLKEILGIAMIALGVLLFLF